jgi:N-methylhydantoinase A/oxoprolinase/acetone carboxylase beta subunit
LQESNLDPSTVSLAAIGGGGGCLGEMIANFLGMSETYVFRQGAVFGAYGTGGMDIVHTYDMRFDLPHFFEANCWDTNCHVLNSSVADLQRTACNDMLGEGFMAGEVNFELAIELVNPVSRSPVKIVMPHPFVWPAQDRGLVMGLAFEKIGDIAKAQRKNIRLSRIFLRAIADVPHSNIVTSCVGQGVDNAHKNSRRVYVGQSAWLEYTVYEWDFLSMPTTLLGPVILESPDTTVVVPQGTVIELDEFYNGIIGKPKNESTNN